MPRTANPVTAVRSRPASPTLRYDRASRAADVAPEARETETMMEERQSIRVTVCKCEQYAEDWPFSDDSKLSDVVAWFAAREQEIPEEFRAKARCEIDSRLIYDSALATIEISYLRSETDQEMADRQQRAARAVADDRARELELLRRLQAKYGVTA